MISPNAHIGEGTIVRYPRLSNIGQCWIGDNCSVHSHIWIGDGVHIGNHCWIEPFVFIPTGVKIGNNVFLGPRVTFTNDKFPPSDREDWQCTLVMDNASIGAGAVILPGIIIGAGARIGAGAVVTKNVPAGETWVGNPARKV